MSAPMQLVIAWCCSYESLFDFDCLAQIFVVKIKKHKQPSNVVLSACFKKRFFAK
jgi:hypothetical protein